MPQKVREFIQTEPKRLKNKVHKTKTKVLFLSHFVFLKQYHGTLSLITGTRKTSSSKSQWAI